MTKNDYRKIITSVSLAGSLFVFLMSTNFADALIHFIAVGEVPGTDYIVPADGMYVVLLVVAIIITTPLAVDIYKEIRRSTSMPEKRAVKRPHRRTVKA